MPSNEPTQSDEELVDNIWDVVRLDSLASSRIGYPRANTKVKIMKLIKAYSLQERIDILEELEYHDMKLKDNKAIARVIAHLKKELEALK